jgi:hypothetical protein
VDEVTEHGDGLAGGFGVGQGDGVTDSETHAEMFGAKDGHKLCTTK